MIGAAILRRRRRNEEDANLLRRRHLRILRDASNPFELNPRIFIGKYRLSQDLALYLCNQIRGDLSGGSIRLAIAPELKERMPFLDIAFEAEVSRYEDPDFEEVAQRNCDEDPKTRHKAIEELRNMIRQRGECNPRRTDDAYLLKFLRCRRFIPALAHKLMVRYEDFRKKNPDLYDCEAFSLDRVKNVYGGTFPESPVNGRIMLMRFGRWDTSAVPVEDVVRCALLMDEIASMQPKLQVLGVTIIVDLEGLSVSHVRTLTPTIAHQIVSLMGVSFPLLNHSLHIIRYSWILNTFFYIFKQFIPAAAWNRLHFHGYDMSSLHKHIDPEYLPPEYGGHCRHVISFEEWVRKVDRYKDDFMVAELRALGYTVSQPMEIQCWT